MIVASTKIKPTKLYLFIGIPNTWKSNQVKSKGDTGAKAWNTIPNICMVESFRTVSSCEYTRDISPGQNKK